MNIIVLAGGVSMERDVSLSSGAEIARALLRAGHRALLLDSFFGMAELPSGDPFADVQEPPVYRVPETAPDIPAIRASRGESPLGEIGPNVLELCSMADIVFLGLHGENGENGRLQALLDMAGVRYTGSGYLGSALAMDKALTKTLFVEQGVPTPRGITLHRGESADAAASLGFPCVVKPVSGGSSVGVVIARNEEALKNALTEAFRYDDRVLVEEYIAGREFSVGVLGGEALPPIEIIPRGEFYDYAHKYQAGWTEEICPARIDENTTAAMQKAALSAFSALHLAVYARMDFMLDANGAVYCLEANTLPGMTPTSLIPQEAAVTGLDYPALCDRVVKLSLEKYKDD